MQSDVITVHSRVPMDISGFNCIATAQQSRGQRKTRRVVVAQLQRGWGFEFDPEIQVALCTAYSDYSRDEILEKLGLSDRLLILKKPFDNIEAIQLVTALTEKWQLVREVRRQVEQLAEIVSRRTEQLRRSEDRYRLIAENAGGLVRSNAASKHGSSSTNKILCEFMKRNLRERPCDFPPPQSERKRPILTELSSRKNLRPAIHRPETGIAQLATAND